MLKNSKTWAFHPVTLDRTMLREATGETEAYTSVDLDGENPTVSRQRGTSVLAQLSGEGCACTGHRKIR